MNLNFLVKNLLVGFFLSVVISLGQYSFAQIDSRNQERPDKKEATSPKKKKKVKKTKKARKQDKGKKTYSNKKQVKKSQKSFKKGGDKGHRGTITGRKVKKTKTTPRQTYARPQPDPYANRRIRTEKQRAGPPPKKIKTATKKGEVARSGDISGRKRIRQRSVSSNPRPVHPQPNTYGVRKRRTEKDRAYSNKKKIKNVRSASRPSEVRKPRSKTRVVTATAPHVVKRKKNVYRNHEQRKGEVASTKDIAGKKLRTKNYKSERPSKGNRAMANPKIRTDKTKSGQRFKSPNFAASSTRSVSSIGENKGGGKLTKNQRSMKNFRSSKAKSVVPQKKPRSYGNSKKGSGEAAVFAGYRPKKIRSATMNAESKPGRRKPKAPSISGARVFSSRKAHPYRGKDRRFSGENSTTKDIAGRSLRTKNFRSRTPNYGSIGSMNFQSGSRAPSNKNRNFNKAKSVSGKSFNNSGRSLTKRTADLAVGSFSGNRKSIKRLQGGGSISKRWNNNGNALSATAGSRGSKTWNNGGKSLTKGGGSINARWNNNGNSLTNSAGSSGSRSWNNGGKSLSRGGGGSISKRWNNNGNPLYKKDRGAGTIVATGYTGRSAIKQIGDAGVGRYSGNMKYQKPLKGGGSISRKWNNNGTPLYKKDRGAGTIAATGYSGRSAIKQIGDAGVGRYSGNTKYKKPLKGGGSISRKWNNGGNPLIKIGRGEGTAVATTFEGNGFARGMNNPNIGSYQGEIKSKNKTSKGYPTQDFIGNVRVVSKKPPKSPGTEYGISTKIAGIRIGTSAGLMLPSAVKNKTNINTLTARVKEKEMKSSPGTELGRKNTLSFINVGNPNISGLVYKQKRLKVNNNLPNQLNRNQKRRTEAAPGTKRGTDWALSFWEFGSPSHMGLAKQHAKARGKLHQSTGFKYAGTNSIEEKQKTVNVKLLWAKLFKKNANTPEPDKEYSHKLKYDKEERSIWETEERENWYNN